MKASSASNKEKENEIFAIDVARMTRLHLIYVTFKMAHDRIKASNFQDPAVKSLVELGIKIFALKQLNLDYQSLYECGYFGQGSGRLLDLSYRGLLEKLRP